MHYHFKSKGEILVQLVERLVSVAQARVDIRLADASDPQARLTAILDGLLVKSADADPDAVATWALVGAEAVRNDEVRALYRHWIEEVRDRLREAFVATCRDQGRSTAGATRAAAALAALVEGYYTLAAGAPGVVPERSAAPAARSIALALVEAQPRR